MKYLTTFFIILLFLSCVSTNNLKQNAPRHFFGEHGKEISKSEFQKKWRNTSLGLTRWDFIDGNKRIVKLSRPLYERYLISYDPFLNNLERITGQDFKDSTTFLISFHHLNDLCTSRWSNTWSQSVIEGRKSRLQPHLAEIIRNYPNVKYFQFFEIGYLLEKKKAPENEYFFTDTGNFLKKSIFKNPTLCGSLALVKSNGQVLVRNGEYSILSMAQHLDEETWKLIFPVTE